MIHRADTGDGKFTKIALTFDDGPDPRHTPRILDILKCYDIKGSFFLVGRNVRRYPELVRRIHEEGHDIGNHTFTHPVSPSLTISSDRLRKEIRCTNAAIKKIIGSEPALFRSTLAFWDPAVGLLLHEARRTGHTVVGWSRSSADWLGSSRLIRYALENRSIRDGDILLWHDGAEKAVIRGRRATELVLPGFIERCLDENILIEPLTAVLENVTFPCFALAEFS